LSVEAGDLTPSLKLKRKVVVQNFSDRIDKLYA
jgi:long-chain acyl-CoA synthetase